MQRSASGERRMPIPPIMRFARTRFAANDVARLLASLGILLATAGLPVSGDDLLPGIIGEDDRVLLERARAALGCRRPGQYRRLPDVRPMHRNAGRARHRHHGSTLRCEFGDRQGISVERHPFSGGRARFGEQGPFHRRVPALSGKLSPCGSRRDRREPCRRQGSTFGSRQGRGGDRAQRFAGCRAGARLRRASCRRPASS